MTAEQISGAAAELEEILRGEAGLVSRLYNCICAEEGAIVEDRLEAITRAVENQEELASALAKAEETRTAKALELAGLLGADGERPSLHEISERLTDVQQAQRLTDAGKRLSDMMEKLRRKNQDVRGILTLRSDYTETMLNLIAGVEDTPSSGYGARGQILNTADPGPGMYEISI